MPLISQLFKARELSVFLFMLIYLLVVGGINPAVLSGESLSSLLNNSVILIFLALGQCYVLLTGEIDVSVGSIMGLSAVVCGTLLGGGTPIFLMVPLVLLTGMLVGLINGLGVTLLRIPSIIMTLGALGTIRGIMLVITNGKWIEDIPNAYKQIAGIKPLGLNLIVWIGIILLLCAHFFLLRTRYGRYFYAVGDNPHGAHLLGIPVKRMKLGAFIISGGTSALAGLCFVMNIGFVPNQTGSGLELSAIAAAVLGGVSLAGGLGTALGAGIGAIFLTLISSSLVFLKIEAYWNNAISGLLLLVIVISDNHLQKWGKKKQAQHHAAQLAAAKAQQPPGTHLAQNQNKGASS